MAKAFKCDRCGKYFSPEDYNHIHDVLRIAIKRNGFVLDICSDCGNSLMNWLLEKEEDKENDDTTAV